MVLCLIGLVIFPILGLFSVKYRDLTKESFKCFFKMATFRPCDSSFDQKIKSGVTSKLMEKHQKLAKFIFGNFKVLSWIFVILFFASIFMIGFGVFNYFAFGNCNGLESKGFCVYEEFENAFARMSPEEINISGKPLRGNPEAAITIIEFACLQCPYSKQAEPTVRQILNDYPDKVKLVHFFFPLSQHNNGILAAKADYCAGEQGKFWEYHDKLFEEQSSFENNVSQSDAKKVILVHAQSFNMNMTKFEACLESKEAGDKVLDDIELGKKLGIEGTPTFFINGKKYVGPQKYSVFEGIIKRS